MMGDKLVYYYLYNEEASFTLGICTHLFNRLFIIIIKKTFIHLSLSSQ